MREEQCCGSVSDPNWLYADPDPAFLVNADPDLGLKTNADPDPRCTLKQKFCQSPKIMLNFNENKVTINICIPITLILILFMPSYLSFSCVFFILALFLPPDPHSIGCLDPDELSL
jgi:hypothetical protein